MAEITARRRGEVVRGVFEVLLHEPAGLPTGDVIAAVRRIVPPTPFELTRYERRPEAERYDRQVRFHTIHAVKAGWLVKDHGIWRLTDAGRQAYADYRDPEEFYRIAWRRYREWRAAQPKPPRGNDARLSRVGDVLRIILPDSWTTYGDLAELTGSNAQAVGQYLAAHPVANAHHVLHSDGRVSPQFRWADPARTDDPRSVLESDGVTFDAAGHADPAQRLRSGDLRELLESDGSLDGVGTDGDDGAERRRAWLVRGSNVHGVNLVRELWLPAGVCSLSAARLTELPPGVSRTEVRAAVDDDYGHTGSEERRRLVADFHSFLSRMRIGDVILTNDGPDVYLGVVTGEPAFVASVGRRANLQRSVDWRDTATPHDLDELPDELLARMSNPDVEVVELTAFVAEFERLLGEGSASAVVERVLHIPDATAELAAALHLDRAWLQECVDLLRSRPQMIFHGPPGTGKTHLALALARHLTGGKRENIQLVQFHPAYTYEDFFEGYRPVKAEGGMLVFELTKGPFRRLVDAAAAHDDPYVLIIDEINRGNLAKIFGELYFLLEFRSRHPVNLLYGSDGAGFTLPHNIVIIGTMNTADRSIALFDAALRRRFWFCELHPDEPPTRGLLGRWLAAEGLPDDAAHLLDELNRRIEDRDFRIGPSYLMQDAALNPKGLERVWRTQILPFLEEHHYGELSRPEVAERYGLPALRRSVGVESSEDSADADAESVGADGFDVADGVAERPGTQRPATPGTDAEL